MGIPADKETRQLRQAVHQTIDPLWQKGDPKHRGVRRRAVYRWLANELGLDEYHTGEANADRCRLVLTLVDEKQPDFSNVKQDSVGCNRKTALYRRRPRLEA